MGVPSSCLCWLHNSGVSTPSIFSQSKNDLGFSLNHLPILSSRPIVKVIFSPSSLPQSNLHTDPYITLSTAALDRSPPIVLLTAPSLRSDHRCAYLLTSVRGRCAGEAHKTQQGDTKV